MPTDRATPVETPLGSDALTFTHLTGREEISRCFAFTVGLVGKDANVDGLKMLGGPLSVEAKSNDPKRWFSGLIAEFRLTRMEDRLAYYEAVVRPWLWFLGNTTDCRIFQNMTAVEIIEKIFSKYGIAKFEKRLEKSYPPRDYCVQYDESDLDFVQRLMEHEGIFYFFEHGDGEHTLVMADAMSKLKPAPGAETVPFRGRGDEMRFDVEFISDWIPGSAVRPGAYAHTDFDFKKPTADLMAQSSQAFSHKEASGENYRQPGAHLDVGRGDAVAAIRREELQAPHQRVTAVGTARGLCPGSTFKLEEFPRDDQNQEYLVVSAEYQLFDPGVRSGLEAEGETYRVVLGVAPTSVPYRASRITPRPIMRGPQTATVVGPSGEEIFTDEYARVKVQFHWDRRRQEGPEQLVLRAGVADLGWQRLGLHPDPADRPGGDRRLHRGRSGPADHHRPRLQRQGDAALSAARQRHPVGLEVELLEGRRRLQRADVRGQGRVRAGQLPGSEGP